MVSEGAPKILKALQGVGDYESVQVLWKCCHDHGIRLKVHPWKSEYRGCVRLVKLPPVINNGFILDRGLEVGGMYEFRHINGHIEVFLDGEFQFSADTMQEAYIELKAG